MERKDDAREVDEGERLPTDMGKRGIELPALGRGATAVAISMERADEAVSE